MAWVATENFDSYSNGASINTLNAGSGWSAGWVIGTGTWTVTNAQSQSSPNSMTSATFGDYVYRQFPSLSTTTDTGTLVFYMRRDTNTAKSWYLDLCNATTYAPSGNILVGMEVGNIVYYTNNTATQNILVTSFTVNTWYKFTIKLLGSNQCIIDINDGQANSGTVAVNNAGSFQYFQIYEGAGGVGTHNVWVDSISPPTTSNPLFTLMGVGT